jgi:hypothetical protein
MMSMAPEKRRATLIAVGLFLLSCMMLTGCGANPVPTGDQLYAEAKTTYFDYREGVNELQLALHDGPWEIGQVGSYGMQPLECDNGDGYYFSLHRNVRLDGSQREDYADTAERFLKEQGFSPTRGTLGADDHDGQLIQVAVRNEEEFALLLVEFRKNGNIGISADTPCHPGDSYELSALLFGGMYLSEGYLPVDAESPRDPLFFGITPGDPQFVRETPTPTPTP